ALPISSADGCDDRPTIDRRFGPSRDHEIRRTIGRSSLASLARSLLFGARMMTTFARKLLVLSALALPVTVAASLLTASPETEAASGDTHFGTYKLRIHATNAEMWKAKWICTDDDFNSLYTIDADTYPASTKTTRETNITADKCHTGKWKVEFYIKFAGNWKRIKPGAGICTTYPSLCGFYPTGND